MRGQTVFIVTEESAVGSMHDIDVRVFAGIKEAQKCYNEKVQLWKDGNGDRWKEDERCMDEWEEIKKTHKIEWI